MCTSARTEEKNEHCKNVPYQVLEEDSLWNEMPTRIDEHPTMNKTWYITYHCRIDKSLKAETKNPFKMANYFISSDEDGQINQTLKNREKKDSWCNQRLLL